MWASDVQVSIRFYAELAGTLRARNDDLFLRRLDVDRVQLVAAVLTVSGLPDRGGCLLPHGLHPQADIDGTGLLLVTQGLGHRLHPEPLADGAAGDLFTRHLVIGFVRNLARRQLGLDRLSCSELADPATKEPLPAYPSNKKPKGDDEKCFHVLIEEYVASVGWDLILINRGG